MADLKYNFDDTPKCPHCNEELDDAPARDFIVFTPNGKPSALPTYDQCGNCDRHYSAQATGENEITFST